jgi:hypothetical protein
VLFVVSLVGLWALFIAPVWIVILHRDIDVCEGSRTSCQESYSWWDSHLDRQAALRAQCLNERDVCREMLSSEDEVEATLSCMETAENLLNQLQEISDCTEVLERRTEQQE